MCGCCRLSSLARQSKQGNSFQLALPAATVMLLLVTFICTVSRRMVTTCAVLHLCETGKLRLCLLKAGCRRPLQRQAASTGGGQPDTRPSGALALGGPGSCRVQSARLGCGELHGELCMVSSRLMPMGLRRLMVDAGLLWLITIHRQTPDDQHQRHNCAALNQHFTLCLLLPTFVDKGSCCHVCHASLFILPVQWSIVGQFTGCQEPGLVAPH